MLQMNYAQEKVRYGRTFDMFFSFRKSYVVSFWFILSYCCVYILVWIHKIIWVYRGKCLPLIYVRNPEASNKKPPKLAPKQPGSQGKDTRIGVQPRSNSYRRSGFSRSFLGWNQVAKLWSKSWVHDWLVCVYLDGNGLEQICCALQITGIFSKLFTSGEFFCSLIHISLVSNAILRRLFEACRLEVHWVLPERRHEVSVSPLADFDHYLSV